MRDQRGVTLIELMITLTVFAIIFSMIYSVYNTFLKTATVERKVVKTEMDVMSIAWPLIKEIQSAGFGIPSGVVPIESASGNLTIRSTAAGNSQHAGKWAQVISTTCVISATNIPDGQKVVVLSSSDKTRISSSPQEVKESGGIYYINVCNTGGDYDKNMAYWTPYEGGADREYYETIYDLRDSSVAPAMCAPGTRSLMRSSSKTGSTNFEPMLDCVFNQDADGDRGFAVKFGCINQSGTLTWHTDKNCTGAINSPKLKMIKVGLIIQSSPRKDSQGPGTVTLFEDLLDVNGNSLKSTINLTDEQRFYKWRKIEQTIALKNLE